MINLLPPVYKKELLKEDHCKIINILGMFILLFLVCLSLILFSIKIYIDGQLAIEKNIVEEYQKDVRFSEIEKTEKEVETINKKILEINSFYKNQSSIIKVLEEISQTFPREIYLTDFSLSLSEEKGCRFLIALSGFSPTTDILYQFRDNLEAKKELFKDNQIPSFPPSYSIQRENIDFDLNMKIK